MLLGICMNYVTKTSLTYTAIVKQNKANIFV